MREAEETGADPVPAGSRYWKIACRVGVYIAGLFILTFGAALSINTRLGLTAANTFPYVFSRVTGISFGVGLILVYLSYVALQWLMLGSRFRKARLLQVPVALLYGRFANFWVQVFGDFVPDGYAGKIGLLAVSIIVIGLGITVYVAPDIVVNPIEGMAGAIAIRLNWPFYKSKILFDCASGAIGIALSLIFLGDLTGIREGTVLSGLLIGKAVHLFQPLLNPLLRRICF